MNGILNWNDAVDYFGNELEPHRKKLCEASWATYGLLACRSAQGGTTRVVNGDGEHAERKLIMSDIWAKDLDSALSTWDPRSTPMLILVLLNRSPCSDCSHLLAGALHQYNDRYALTTEKQHFILGSLGYYHSNKPPDEGKGQLPKTFSTDRGMRAMIDAGWKLCVIDFGPGLTRRGHELHTYLKGLTR